VFSGLVKQSAGSPDSLRSLPSGGIFEMPAVPVTSVGSNSLTTLVPAVVATSDIRAEARDLFFQSLPFLARISKGEVGEASMGTAVRACDLLGRYGLGEAKVVLPEELVRILGLVLGQDSRIPAECIEDVTASLIANLSEL
jgi:hypothetical protein